MSSAVETYEAEMARDIVKFFKREYRLVQYHNPLTNEIYFYIEERLLFWWRTVRVKNEVYQKYYGCDRDGMFNTKENAVKVLKFLKGITKLEKKVVTNIDYGNE